jgi:hypothetical protein
MLTIVGRTRMPKVVTKVGHVFDFANFRFEGFFLKPVDIDKLARHGLFPNAVGEDGTLDWNLTATPTNRWPLSYELDLDLYYGYMRMRASLPAVVLQGWGVDVLACN